MKPINQSKIRDYIDNNGNACLYCESDDIAAVGGVDVEDGVGTQAVKCNTCKKTWNDVYRLVNISEDRS